MTRGCCPIGINPKMCLNSSWHDRIFSECENSGTAPAGGSPWILAAFMRPSLVVSSSARTETARRPSRRLSHFGACPDSTVGEPRTSGRQVLRDSRIPCRTTVKFSGPRTHNAGLQHRAQRMQPHLNKRHNGYGNCEVAELRRRICALLLMET